MRSSVNVITVVFSCVKISISKPLETFNMRHDIVSEVSAPVGSELYAGLTIPQRVPQTDYRSVKRCIFRFTVELTKRTSSRFGEIWSGGAVNHSPGAVFFSPSLPISSFFFTARDWQVAGEERPWLVQAPRLRLGSGRRGRRR